MQTKLYGKKSYLGLLSPQELEQANKMQVYLENIKRKAE